ncbi:molecular chaperone DnaJ [Exophiala viscosa]|uniref:Molecular chaperone DnaJ n=1 Tax=Exophiala viscosa TaxID=2486360 RepID=A0AAN6E4X1_9EURO|nr:molecular chaperone DnaJ [Exophiala viscosa]
MVKADVKRDYYADLDLPPTADTEDIKKQFRYLAKQYHPDRNPGHEIEVVPKFQAVQAAHEILSDPVQKSKYDAARARIAAVNTAASATNYSDPYGFARAATSKPATTTPQFPFPPPPKANEKRTAPQTPKSQGSRGAEKFNAFVRGAPQSWDRARFDDARAEAARAFPNMRTTQSTQQMPPRPPRQAPTAPKPPHSADTPHLPNVPPTTFPGLSRTQSTRSGHGPSAYGSDDYSAARSAYSHVRGRGGPPPSSHPHPHDAHTMHSPPRSRARPAVSPLRQARSTEYHHMRNESAGDIRPSSRYAGVGGERTDLHGEGLHRSASVRNSPVDPHWDDRGPFGKPNAHFEHVPRHRSASPGMRPAGKHAEYSSESSSSDDEELNINNRPKAPLRTRPRPQQTKPTSDNNPGLTGQFPNTNYTRIVDHSQYNFPAPEAREPLRRPFPDMPSPAGETPMHGAHGIGGKSDGPKYASPCKASYPWSQNPKSGRAPSRGYSFNGVPSWAVPSSVYPQSTPTRRPQTHKNDDFSSGQTLFLKTVPLQSFRARGRRANTFGSPEPAPPLKFSAADWQDKLSADDIFRPSDSQMRKSPSKLNRTGSKPATRGRGMSKGIEQEGSPSADSATSAEANHGDDSKAQASSDKAAAFQQGKLPPDWASTIKTTAAQPPRPETGRSSQNSTSTVDSRDHYVVVEEDAMDVDDTPPVNGQSGHSSNGGQRSSAEFPKPGSRRSSVNGGVDLREFTQQAPFAPTAAGLKDLDDLAANLPFQSKPAENLDGSSKPSARLRALNLPKPPKVVVPPAADRLDPANFMQYVDNMNVYMREWNSFNAKMIEHFRNRQDRVCGTMSQTWISQQGDGPGADELDENGNQKAGYAAYIQWLKDDAQCREWWDHANENHMQCLEDLGRAREVAKKKLRPA